MQADARPVVAQARAMCAMRAMSLMGAMSAMSAMSHWRAMVGVARCDMMNP
jgi:hypothetical protein